MKPEPLYVALVQADLAWKDKTSNFIKMEKWLESNKQPLDLVVLPEMFATGFVTEPQDVAETMEGQTVSWLKKQAVQYQCVVMGSVIIEQDGKYFNRLIWVDRHGEIKYYDKRHLFTYGGEHERFTAGKEKLIVELNGWKICPLVCYDLRFPVWAKNTYHNGDYGYDVLIYIANWPSVRSHSFRQLLISRAIENHAYVIGVNRVGVDGKGLYYQGNSTVIDFKGNHIVEIEPDAEAFEIVHLSYDNLLKARQDFPVGADWDDFTIS